MPEKVLLIIPPFDFSEVEYQTLKEIFNQQHLTVELASTISGECIGDQGTRVPCQKRVSEISAHDYIAVILIGGYGVIDLIEDQHILDLFSDAYGLGLVVGAIGIGPKILAQSGFLYGRRATVADSRAEELKQKGVHILNQSIVTDGNIVTARDSEYTDEFAHAILAAL